MFLSSHRRRTSQWDTIWVCPPKLDPRLQASNSSQPLCAHGHAGQHSPFPCWFRSGRRRFDAGLFARREDNSAEARLGIVAFRGIASSGPLEFRHGKKVGTVFLRSRRARCQGRAIWQPARHSLRIHLRVPALRLRLVLDAMDRVGAPHKIAIRDEAFHEPLPVRWASALTRVERDRMGLEI